MSNLVLDNLSPTLPWDPLPGESNRLRGLLAIFLILAFLIMLIVPHVELPKVDRAKAEAVPESLAKVVLERKEVPPPPPPPVEKVKKEEVKKEETTAKKEEAAPKPVEETAPKPVVTDLQRSAARARASQAIQEAGIADALKDLRDMDVGAAATPHGMPGQTGNGTGGLITSTEEAGTSRNLITSKAGSGSGAVGAYAGGMSSGYGGGKAGGKGTAGMLGTGGAGGAGGKLQAVQSNVASAAAAASASRVGKDGKSHRTTEDIRKVLDRYGARLNNLYQRALRDDPTMQGTVMLKLSVAPDGSVTAVSVANSQLNNADLENKIAALVRGFNFGAMEVEAWSGNYELNFLPQ